MTMSHNSVRVYPMFGNSVAVVGDRVVGAGRTHAEALAQAGVSPSNSVREFVPERRVHIPRKQGGGMKTIPATFRPLRTA